MTDIYKIKKRLAVARKLIENGDEASLRYACLELRLCLETIAYRHLQEYGETFPGHIVGEWKPDHIVKVLASFDPVNAQSGKISFRAYTPGEVEPAGEFIEIGESKAIPWRKFRQLYNKLGNYLHMPAPEKKPKPRKPLTSDTFTDILAALDDAAAATVIFAVKHVINATCDCGNTLYVGASEFDNSDPVVCGNTKCNLPWAKFTTEDGTQVLRPVSHITITCRCEATLHIPQERAWAPFRCRNCGTSQKLIPAGIEHYD